MPINFPNLPYPQFPNMQLTGQPTGGQGIIAGLAGGLEKGMDAYKAMQLYQQQLLKNKQDMEKTELETQLAKLNLKNAPEKFKAELQGKLLENQQKQQSLRKEEELFPTLKPAAQANIRLANSQAEYHDRQAAKLKYQQEHGYTTPADEAQIQMHEQQANYYKAQSRKINQEADLDATLNQAGQIVGQNGIVGGNAGSTYGIPNPQLTVEDIMNKRRGIDTYSYRAKSTELQQQKEQKAIEDSSKATDMQIAALDHQKDLFNEYDRLMGNSLEGGTVLGRTPDWATFGSGQDINRLVNEMASYGISSLKSEMGGGSRWNILEFKSALGRKPQRNWSKGARDEYRASLDMLRDRADEISKMKRTVLNNPKLGIGDHDMRALINAYNKAYPIVNEKGQFNRGNLGHWEEFFTPEAIKAIKNGEDYKPKSKKGDPNVIDTEIDPSGKLVKVS